jgi:phosphoribosylamine--glycine ligase
MRKRAFGSAGDRIVLEEFLEGPELSILAVYDGEAYRLFVPSQDHKRAFDGDAGPNTGGMGAYSPVSLFSEKLAERVRREIVEPTFAGMRSENVQGAGVLYFGLTVTAEGPKVLEYNCRFGDPETQVILPLLEGDLFEVLHGATHGRLDAVPFANSGRAAACVVVASGGYPGSYAKGYPIDGLDEARDLGCIVFHAGTVREGDVYRTAGGRVLGVTAVAPTLDEALESAYRGVKAVHFTDCFSRSDIGKRSVQSA